MSFSVIHLINQLLGGDSVAVTEQNPPPVRLREDEWHKTYESPVPTSDVEKESSSSRAPHPKAPSNLEPHEEKPTADCQIGATPSAPCLRSNGEISSATADFDAVVTSDVEEKKSVISNCNSQSLKQH